MTFIRVTLFFLRDFLPYILLEVVNSNAAH